MNKPLLRKIQKAILKAPDQFEMDWYFQDKLTFPGGEVTAGGCGTAGCIAGWAAHLASGRKKLVATRKALFGAFEFYEEGKRTLQLTDRECERLFGEGFWPLKFQLSYKAAKAALPRAKVAVKRIDHFIKTNGAE